MYCDLNISDEGESWVTYQFVTNSHQTSRFTSATRATCHCSPSFSVFFHPRHLISGQSSTYFATRHTSGRLMDFEVSLPRMICLERVKTTGVGLSGSK